jgi:hypothetical protein
MAGQGMMGDNGVCGGSGMMRGMGGRGMMHGGGMMRACTGIPGTSVEIPQEIRDKQVEMNKLRLDMRNEIRESRSIEARSRRSIESIPTFATN